MSMPHRYLASLRPLVLLLLAALALTVSCESCESCQEQAPEPTVEPEPEPEPEPEVDEEAELLEEATEAAESEAVSASLHVADIARIAAGEIEAAAEAEDQPKARIKRDKAKLGGSIDTAAVKAVFDQHEAELQKCYERALKRDPALEGRVSVYMRIEPSGRTSTVRASSPTLTDSAAIDCMERAVRSWQFPSPEGGAVELRKPFAFRPDM